MYQVAESGRVFEVKKIYFNPNTLESIGFDCLGYKLSEEQDDYAFSYRNPKMKVVMGTLEGVYPNEEFPFKVKCSSGSYRVSYVAEIVYPFADAEWFLENPEAESQYLPERITWKDVRDLLNNSTESQLSRPVKEGWNKRTN